MPDEMKNEAGVAAEMVEREFGPIPSGPILTDKGPWQN
jgi:hypothetical protein